MVFVFLVNSLRKTPEENEVVNSLALVREVEAVAALGQLSPSGDIRMLAAPISGFGGTPRIEKLYVDEGDQVSVGKVLAIFDNQPQILADIEISKSRLAILADKLISQEREVERYKELVLKGASPKVLMDEKIDYLRELLGKKNELLAEIKALEVDLFDSQLRSPIDGIVLKINSREGERPGLEGVLQVGSSQEMEALIEVYESDIDRVSIGQKVSLISENGGFSGTLEGEVRQISPRVSQRIVLATDPTGDADARIVEVRVSLQKNSALKVKNFTGMKVIARFEP